MVDGAAARCSDSTSEERTTMAANVFGAWSWICIFAITLAALAVAVPIAVIKALSLLEQAGAALVGRLDASNHDLRTGNPTNPAESNVALEDAPRLGVRVGEHDMAS